MWAVGRLVAFDLPGPAHLRRGCCGSLRIKTWLNFRNIKRRVGGEGADVGSAWYRSYSIEQDAAAQRASGMVAAGGVPAALRRRPSGAHVAHERRSSGSRESFSTART